MSSEPPTPSASPPAPTGSPDRLALIHIVAVFTLSIVVVLGAFVLIAVERQPEVDTAMVGIISSVVTAWAAYFARLGGYRAATREREQ